MNIGMADCFARKFERMVVVPDVFLGETTTPAGIQKFVPRWSFRGDVERRYAAALEKSESSSTKSQTMTI